MSKKPFFLLLGVIPILCFMLIILFRFFGSGIPFKEGPIFHPVFVMGEEEKLPIFVGEKEKPLSCKRGICYIKEGVLKIKGNGSFKNISFSLREEAKLGIKVGKPEYLIIYINGNPYYRKIREGDEIKLVKEFGLRNKEKYYIKLNSISSDFPVLKIEKENGKLLFRINGTGNLILRISK